MKTIVCENPGQFVLKHSAKPVASPGHAIVRIRRIGICGTDLHAYRGRQPYFTYPRILGHELSGTIEEMEDDVSGLQIGDCIAVIPYLECGVCQSCRSGKPNCCTQLKVLGVHTDGGMQEYMSLPIDHLLPTNDLSLEAAAIVECLSIGAHAVRRARLDSAERILVIGAGPIGLGVMKYAQMSGATVVAMDLNEERLKFCREWASVDETITVHGDVEERLRSVFKGELPDVVFDATGNKASMESAFRLVANGGRLILVGLVNADLSFNDPLFHAKEMTLLSSRNATREDFMTVLDSIRSNAVQIEAFISHRSGFETMIQEFEHWLDPASGVIKAMVVMD